MLMDTVHERPIYNMPRGENLETMVLFGMKLDNGGIRNWEKNSFE
jgi:hypothetical protein